jgi:alpha-beta hydrolase superfamily lysophospholipase
MGNLMTRHTELTIKAGDGTPLFVTDSLIDTPSTVKGGIVLMHGLGEHSGRYAHVIRFFNERDLSVRAYDHRGHGRSGGVRGDVPGDATMLQDAKIVVDDFARQLNQNGSVPLLLLGHSMGGLFAARFAAARVSPLHGLILSSPALALHLSKRQRRLLKFFRLIAPGLGIPNGLKTQYLSHDPQVEIDYRKDPLVHPKISARLLSSMLAAIDFSQSHAGDVVTPTLLVVSGSDYLVDATGSDMFFRQLPPGIGTMHRYDHFYHEIFNEVDAHRVFNDVGAWLDRIL